MATKKKASTKGNSIAALAEKAVAQMEAATGKGKRGRKKGSSKSTSIDTGKVMTALSIVKKVARDIDEIRGKRVTKPKSASYSEGAPKKGKKSSKKSSKK